MLELTPELLEPLIKDDIEENPILQIKFEHPPTGWEWYPTFFNLHSLQFYGFVRGIDKEWGNFSLDELNSIKDIYGMGVVQDKNFKPIRFSELQKCL